MMTSFRQLSSFAVVTLSFMMLAGPAAADDTGEIRDIRKCRSIEGRAERLLCYDTLADGGVYGQKQVEKVQRENFGSKDKEPEISVDKLTVTIVRVQEGQNRVRYFHTADGRVWKQNGRGKWNMEVPFQAEIRSGMMGSFFLVTENGKSTRVRRVR